MSSTDRRNFINLVGLSGIGSVLLAQRALASPRPGQAGGSSAVEAQLVPPPSPDQNLIQDFLGLGIGQTNISQVRDIIVNTIPSWDLDSMTNDLLGARAAYVAGAQDIPPEALSFEATFNLYSDDLANQVLALGGASGLNAVQKAVVSDPDQDPIDAWTLVHFASGYALGKLGFGFFSTFLILVLWEVIEPKIWKNWNESPANQVVDVIAGMLGWAVAQVN